MIKVIISLEGRVLIPKCSVFIQNKWRLDCSFMANRFGPSALGRLLWGNCHHSWLVSARLPTSRMKLSGQQVPHANSLKYTVLKITKISCYSHIFNASQMLRIGRLGDVHCIWQDPDKLLQAARRCPIAIEVRNEFALAPSEGFLPLVKLLLFWTQHDAPTVHKLLFCMHSACQTNPLCRIRSNGALSNLVLGHCSCKHFKRL